MPRARAVRPLPAGATPLDERTLLRAGARALGVELAEGQLDRLLHFRDLLHRWNRVYNLTAVREPRRMLEHHLLDSLSAVAPLRRDAGAGRPTSLLDVGSGGGLPGVVLAIADPAWSVTCVDAVAKKTGFVRQVAAELGLQNLHAVHARVEALEDAVTYDRVIARAFGSLGDLAALTRPKLAPGGVWMCMKARLPADEIAALPPGVEVFHVEPLTVPGLDGRRCLLWMRPTPCRPRPAPPPSAGRAQPAHPSGGAAEGRGR